MKSTVFIAFSNKKTAVSIAKIVIANGMHVACLATSLAELKKHIHAYEGGTIVCGCQFTDDYIMDFIEDVPPYINIVMIGKRPQLDLCQSERVFKLAVPLQSVELICSLNMLNSMEDYISTVNRNPDEEKIILKAKRTLINRYYMTEEQAHRYMQKKSMDSGRKLVDIAKIILQ